MTHDMRLAIETTPLPEAGDVPTFGEDGKWRPSAPAPSGPTVLRGIYLVTGTCADGVQTALSWAEAGFGVQTHPLDLTNPLQPKTLVAGELGITIVGTFGVALVANAMYDLDIDFLNADDNNVKTAIPPGLDPNGDPLKMSLALEYPSPVNGVAHCSAVQASGGPLDFAGEAYVKLEIPA